MTDSKDDKKFKETVDRLLKSPPKPHKEKKGGGASAKKHPRTGSKKG